MVRMRLAERLELVGRAAVLEAAAGVHVGQHDDLVGRQDLGGLGHEADAAKGDHVGVGRRALRDRSRLSPTKSARSWSSGFW